MAGGEVGCDCLQDVARLFLAVEADVVRDDRCLTAQEGGEVVVADLQVEVQRCAGGVFHTEIPVAVCHRGVGAQRTEAGLFGVEVFRVVIAFEDLQSGDERQMVDDA